jgi:nucleotidyltransferase substrate binding protein (TIGR01987 family)
MNREIRWKQRFSNFQKALNQLKAGYDLMADRPLSDLEKQGLIQAFEFTHELAWKTLKDFLENQGHQNLFGSKDTTRKAFELGLLSDGEIWMSMIASRNLSSHTYDLEIAEAILTDLRKSYLNSFLDLLNTLTIRAEQT